jgi:hypothetical protein
MLFLFALLVAFALGGAPIRADTVLGGPGYVAPTAADTVLGGPGMK